MVNESSSQQKTGVPQATNTQVTNGQATNTQEADMTAIKTVYNEMYEYEISKDIDKLGSLLSENYVLIHMTGLHQSKAEYLNSVRDGNLNYYTAETDQVTVDLQSDSKAVLVGRSRVNAAVFGGSRNTWRLQLVIDMEKQNGRWLMTRAQASTY